MKRTLAAPVLLTLALAGCGSQATTSSTTRATANTTSTQGARKLAYCAGTTQSMLTFANDLGPLGRALQAGTDASAAAGTVVADAANATTAFRQLRSALSDPGQQAVVDQMIGVLGQAQSAARSTASGDIGSVVGELAGAGDQVGPLTRQITRICTT